MKKKFLAAPLLIAAILTGCDEGRIYDEGGVVDKTGAKATLTGTLTGNPAWGDGYALSLAGFTEGSDYAIISKDVMPDAEGNCDFVLEGLPAETSTVELCVIDRLRRRVATFLSVPCRNEDVTIDARGVDISMFGAIQNEIFTTTCAQCHGGTGSGAANLMLTDGKSYADLVGVESVKEPGVMRVMPGKADESLLYRILSTDESASWHYDHSVEVVSTVRLDLIKNWINNGASND